MIPLQSQHTPAPIETERNMYIPPLTSNINFSAVVPTTKTNVFKAGPPLTLPETWNWKEISAIDSNEIIKRKKQISDSGNQELCGSCWAKATASLISDNFVTTGILEQNPGLSSTYILSCYPQAQCRGGNPAEAISTISNFGIADRHCVDYSWCDNNMTCNGKATRHFTEEIDLSSLIPSCGCFNKGTHYKYRIAPPELVSIPLDHNDDTLDYLTRKVKEHIYTVGPVLGGFLVFDNFIHGRFTKLGNGGVYLEHVDYSGSEPQFIDGYKPKYLGAHAISILGWGIQKKMQTGKDTFEDIPYWFCRNSWTNSWGDNGCFKIAMYPHNRLSQFMKLVMYPHDGMVQLGGGIVLIRPIGTPKLEEYNTNNYTGKLNQVLSFYNTLPTLFSPQSTKNYKDKLNQVLSFYTTLPTLFSPQTDSNVNTKGVIITIIVCVLLVISIYIYVKRR